MIVSFRLIVRNPMAYIVYSHDFSVGAQLYEQTPCMTKQLKPCWGVGVELGVVVCYNGRVGDDGRPGGSLSRWESFLSENAEEL